MRNFLREQGVREPAARVLWTLGMRESGGNPQLIASGVTQKLRPDQIDPNSSAQRYDVGLWQINSSHLPEVKKVFGPAANMLTLLDPVRNFQYVRHLSKNFTDWTPWALNPDGYTFNWEDYPPSYVEQWGSKIEANHHRIWETYPGLTFWDGVVPSRFKVLASQKLNKATKSVWRVACRLSDLGYGVPKAVGEQKYPANAVWDFQQDKGLSPDGRYTRETESALWGTK